MSFIKHRKYLFIFSMAVLFLATSVAAQEQRAAIQGTITDASGAPLPGVTVEAVSDSGLRLTTMTNSEGVYRFPSVPPGNYDIKASLSGFVVQTRQDLQVRLGESPKVDMSMRMAGVAESITVTAEAPLVDVTSSATATSIKSEFFEKLPKGRGFESVAVMAPGAADESKAGGISMNGASGAENKYVLDGVDTTHPQTGVAGKFILNEFIEEVQVKTAGYEAEFGGSTGGVVNVITKSGTNELHGSLVGYVTNSSWNGDERITLQTNPAGTVVDEHLFRKDDVETFEPGFSLGGPILRDRLWFFAAYEPIMQDTSRTVDFRSGAADAIVSTDTFDQEFDRDNAVASLTGNVGSRFLFKGTYNLSDYEQTNLLPAKSGRASSNRFFYEGRKDILENYTVSGYADYVASPEWLLSLRGGRFYRNFNQEGYPTDPNIVFFSGGPGVFPEVPAELVRGQGFTTLPGGNRSVTRDEYIRDNLTLDVSFFPTWMGTHQLKGGVQIENLENDVIDAEKNYLIRAFWNAPTRFSAERGRYGGAEVRVFGTFGSVKSENTGFFIQDSWTMPNGRLTLNIGVRTEQEKVPSYADPALGLRKYAIEFDYGDKLAPRLGFAYDILGDGRWKAYGSYGTFYDITKMEMPRGSFGGDKWINWLFKIDEFDWTRWTCTNIVNDQTANASCTGMTLIGNIDLRHPSLDLIEPDLKPMESEEYTLGLEHELTPSMKLSARYIRKQLVRAIEDVGVLVEVSPGVFAEEFFIANPGEGIARHILGPDFPAMPKAKRDYDGFELSFTKRFSNNWQAHIGYLFSNLEGNYSGLASSDEALAGNARTSPNVNRFFDSLFGLFDASGSKQGVEGDLATDREHQLKAQFSYSFPFGTTASVTQFFGSGLPNSTEMSYHGVFFFPFGRGDMEDTPSISQTNLYLQHDLRIFGDNTLSIGVNVLNLFDQDEATAIWNSYSSVGVEAGGITDESFFEGFDPIAALAGQRLDPRYGHPSQYQSPREVRLSAKFTF